MIDRDFAKCYSSDKIRSKKLLTLESVYFLSLSYPRIAVKVLTERRPASQPAARYLCDKAFFLLAISGVCAWVEEMRS